MELTKCDFCQKEFYRKSSHISYFKNHYCSPKCQHDARRAGKLIKCFSCGKEAYKAPKDLNRSKSKNYFCSRQCSNLWIGTTISRENHPNWKGGQYSYKEAMKRIHKFPRCVLCTEPDKRILAVHHIDKNRKNNNIENLMWLCHNCHFLIHHYSRERNRLLKIHAHS